jgi:hypothetical protein
MNTKMIRIKNIITTTHIMTTGALLVVRWVILSSSLLYQLLFLRPKFHDVYIYIYNWDQSDAKVNGSVPFLWHFQINSLETYMLYLISRTLTI